MVSINATVKKTLSRDAAIALMCAIAMAATLSGCKSGDVDRFDQTALSFLVKGKTNREQAIAELGQPTTSSFSFTSQHQMSWKYNQAAVDGKTYLPFSGVLLGKGTGETKVLTAAFNRQGILVHYEWMDHRLLSYVHARVGGGGVKDLAQANAKKAGAGKFAPSRSPVRLVTP